MIENNDKVNHNNKKSINTEVKNYYLRNNKSHLNSQTLDKKQIIFKIKDINQSKSKKLNNLSSKENDNENYIEKKTDRKDVTNDKLISCGKECKNSDIFISNKINENEKDQYQEIIDINDLSKNKNKSKDFVLLNDEKHFNEKCKNETENIIDNNKKSQIYHKNLNIKLKSLCNETKENKDNMYYNNNKEIHENGINKKDDKINPSYCKISIFRFF